MLVPAPHEEQNQCIPQTRSNKKQIRTGREKGEVILSHHFTLLSLRKGRMRAKRKKRLAMFKLGQLCVELWDGSLNSRAFLCSQVDAPSANRKCTVSSLLESHWLCSWKGLFPLPSWSLLLFIFPVIRASENNYLWNARAAGWFGERAAGVVVEEEVTMGL